MKIQAFLVGALMSFAAQAHKNIETDLVCPIGDEKFRTMLAASGTSFWTFLDLKPYGPIAAPWPLSKCPTNGFVMFQDKFSGSELSRLELFVASTQYHEMKDTHTNHYLAAVLQRQIDAPIAQVADTLLKATSEAGGDRYAAYASEAMEAYILLLKTESQYSKSWGTYQLIAGELERRLGRFDDAANRFRSMKDKANLQPFIMGIVDFQLQLFSGHNSTYQRILGGKK